MRDCYSLEEDHNLSSGAEQFDEARGWGGRWEEEVTKPMSHDGGEVCHAQLWEGETSQLQNFSLINLIKRDAQGKLEEELCHAKNEIEEMKLVSEKKSSHMFTHKIHITKEINHMHTRKFCFTCSPTHFWSHVSLKVLVTSLIKFWSDTTATKLAGE